MFLFIFTKPGIGALTSMKMTIMRGIPGSGKTRQALAWTMGSETVLVLADNHPGLYTLSEDGKLAFHFELLGDAHAGCFRQAVEAIVAGRSVVVDNTNTTATEVAPYLALGNAFGAEVEIVRIDCPAEVGARRNNHGVPLKACEAMAKRLAEPLPPFFPKEIVLPAKGI